MNGYAVCLGEALIDLIPTDATNATLGRMPGGAPANVAVGLARQGVETYFVGRLGRDAMGDFLVETLADYGVKTDAIQRDAVAHTGLVVVTLAANGERSFEFYVNPSADQLIDVKELDETLIKQAAVVHVGSLSLIHEAAYEATWQAIRWAKEAGSIISYDPNLRPSLWPNLTVAKEKMTALLREANLVKMSEEEAFFFTGETELAAAIAQLYEQFQLPLFFVTLGEHGCYVVEDGSVTHVPARQVVAVDTTGAGDAFVSGLLAEWLRGERDGVRLATVASISGALAASVKGAMSALPTRAEVERQLEE